MTVEQRDVLVLLPTREQLRLAVGVSAGGHAGGRVAVGVSAGGHAGGWVAEGLSGVSRGGRSMAGARGARGDRAGPVSSPPSPLTGGVTLGPRGPPPHA